MSNDIYCEQCRVRPREMFCDWCNAHICRYCTETEHKCNESSHDLNILAHEMKQGAMLKSAAALEQQPVELVNQLDKYVNQESDLAIEYYKNQHDRLLERHQALEADHNSLNQKIKELEASNAFEMKAIAESYSAQVNNHIAEVEKKANEIITDYQTKIKELEEQNNTLQAKMSESLKKVQSPRKTAPVQKVSQPSQSPKEKPGWH